MCQKGVCDSVDRQQILRPWLKKFYPFFQNPNTRIDFCEADAMSHTCRHDGLMWQANSHVASVNFTIPVARTLPAPNTLMIDYLVLANEFMPNCDFSKTTFDITKDVTFRMVSNAFNCRLSDIGKTELQLTFFFDFIDFDHGVVGGNYTIQMAGEIASNASGYALLQFRDGATALPLIAQSYPGKVAQAPNKPVNQIYRERAAYQNQKAQSSAFVSENKDWWSRLKHSFNLDSDEPYMPGATSSSTGTDQHWWDSFTDTFKKVIYLEPLE